MSGLHDALDGYLTVRRALGHKLTGAEYLLRQFLDWLDEAGAATITTDLALAWALKPAASTVYHAQRLSAVRGFASWLHSSDPLTQVPPAGLLPARPARPLPYLYRPEEITAIMDAARRLRLHPASRCAYFARTSTGAQPSHLTIEQVDAALVGAFLDHLEHDRGVSIATRNARLAAVHSLFRFAALRHPEHAELISRVLAIPVKRAERAIVAFLTAEETDALLAAPDLSRRAGGETTPCWRWRSRPGCGSRRSPGCASPTCTWTPARTSGAPGRAARTAPRR